MASSEYLLKTTGKLRGGEYLALLFHALEIPYLFTLPGSQDLPVLDAIPRYSPQTFVIASRNERVSVHIAEGYGKASGRVAVTLPTLGPGIANEFPALYSALLSQSPLLSISPAQPPNKLARLPEVFQGLDPLSLLQPITKSSFRCETPSDLAPMVLAAAHTALASPPGPVHLEISFPILFSLHRFPPLEDHRLALDRQKVTPKHLHSPPPGFRVTDTLGSDPFQETFPSFPLLKPGIPQATAPFALGIALAYRNLPILISISHKLLECSLDCLVLAEELRIPLFLGRFSQKEQKKERLFPWLSSLKPLPTLNREINLLPGLYFAVR